MNLKQYLKSLDEAQAEDFAKRCGTSVAYLKKLAGGWGGAQSGEGLAINIERESDGAVTCEELRPDVDWDFLRGSVA